MLVLFFPFTVTEPLLRATEPAESIPMRFPDEGEPDTFICDQLLFVTPLAFIPTLPLSVFVNVICLLLSTLPPYIIP